MEKRQDLINYILENGKEESWYELALLFNIKPGESRKIRSKAANDVWRTYQRKVNRNVKNEVSLINKFENIVKEFLNTKTSFINKPSLEVCKSLWKTLPDNLSPKNVTDIEKQIEIVKQIQTDFRKSKVIKISEEQKQLLDIYNQVIEEKEKNRKKLFFDIETSPNIVLSWRVGHKINLDYDNILQERSIICVSYKWENDPNVYSITWNEGDDKELLSEFSKVIDSADEIVTQNGDKFDVKWLRTRCIYHNIPISPKFNSIDTLKLAKTGFLFNSNKLDYMGSYLGVGNKIETTYGLWKDILLKNDKKALKTIVEYCEEDVRLLERVYNRLKPYCPEKKFRYLKS